MLIRIATEEGLHGPHLQLFEAIGRVHDQVLGRRLPLNGAGVCGAALADLGLPIELLRGFRPAGPCGRTARTAGRGATPADRHGHLSRGRRQCRSTSTRAPIALGGSSMATIAAVIASTHHPFYYRASTSTGADRPPFADEWVEKILRFRETLTRARPDVLVMVGSDHFHQLWLDNMPQFLVGKAPFFDANFYNEEREFGLPRMTLRGQEDLAAHILRNGLDLNFDLAFSNELRIDHSITCPIITLRPRGRPADRADLHQHLRPADAAAASVRRARPGHPRAGGELAVGPPGGDHRHRPPLPRARRTAPVRSARARPGLRPQGGGVDRDQQPRGLSGRGDAGQPARARQCDPRFHGLHVDDGGGR